jgi:hypothetical protein
VFAYTGLALGAALQLLGLMGLFKPLQSLIDALLIVQALWFVAAAVVLTARRGTGSFP